MTGARVRRVHVVVPARDEAELVGRCLEGIEHAAGRLSLGRPDVAVTVTVVLDRCRDATAEVVAAHPDVVAVPVESGIVGRTRAFGIEVATGSMPPGAWSGTWIANTDADTVVPPHWLVRQVELAEAGADAVVGTVWPDPDETGPGLLERWLAGHALGEEHLHVHGANLGFRLDAYRQVGGFLPVAEHEDVLLVDALRAAGRQVMATATTQVTTSARRWGRLEAGGFAGYLRALTQLDTQPES